MIYRYVSELFKQKKTKKELKYQYFNTELTKASHPIA